MANTYGLFWDSVSGDRLYNAASFEEWLKKFFTTGVFNGDLQVVEDSGMTVTVNTGYCNVDGKVRFFDTNNNFTIATANGTYPRIDTVVIERNDTNREITMKVVTGSYSGNDPSPTAPVRTGGIYQIVIANIYVGAGVTAIGTVDITDTRPDTDVCGWVTGTVDSVNVEQLTAQAQAQFETWFEHMKGQLSEDAAGNLQLEIDGLTERIANIETYADTLAGSIATIETSPATANHSVGEYIVYNGQLYKVTSAITAGTTLTGKISAVSVGSEIASLNSSSMQNRKLLGSGTPNANTSYALNESVSNYKYVEIILVKQGGNGGAFVNKLVNIDNIGMGNVETLALSVYNTSSYHLHMECGFESATSFKIASYTCVGWTMSNVYIVGVSK